MIFQPTALEPVKRPTLHDAKTIGDPTRDADLVVAVGGVAFSFWRLASGDWTGGRAMTIGRGFEIDERWLTAARGVAAEALRVAIMAAGEPGEEPAATVRCEECERLLTSPELVRAEAVAEIRCGPEHVVAFVDGRELIFGSTGPATWIDRAPETARSR